MTYKSDRCQTSTCDPSVGCVYQNIACPNETANACVLTGCDSSYGCYNQTVNCNDGDVCTTDYCDQSSGVCLYLVTNCDDNNACTTDTCVPFQGCSHVFSCTSPPDLCYTVICLNGTCTYPPIDCDDQDPCTTDVCIANSGCAHYAKCDDHNICSEDFCDSVTGECFYASHDFALTECKAYNCYNNTLKVWTPPCDDGDYCTNDTCYFNQCMSVSNGAFCSNCTSVNCTAASPCMKSECDPMTAQCVNTTSTYCDDMDMCTIDICTPINETFATCTHTAVSCTTEDPCFPASCDPITGLCIESTLNCDDGNACTVDSCSGGSCVNYAKCSPFGCYTATCTDGVCSYPPIDCDDGNPCTEDSCTSYMGGLGVCIHTAKNCKGSDPCSLAYCDYTTGQCVNATLDCDDHNLCTEDVCFNETCIHNTVYCGSFSPCDIAYCDPLIGCTIKSQCQTTDLCVTPSCTLNPTTGYAICSFITKQCTSNDPCTPQECNRNTGQCEPAGVPKCMDYNDCSLDFCNGTCQHILNGCNDEDMCTIDYCSGGSCQINTINCDDFNLCTIDSCDPLQGCINDAKSCEDGKSRDFKNAYF